MDLQLSISDLASADPRAAFVVFGTVKDPSRIPGAAVVRNPYVASAKFVLQKNATERDIRKTAEQIVKSREEIKQKTLAAARQKIGDILWVEDIVIRNVDLSPELERAIEAKMVAEQQAVQARFSQQQVQVEAETAVIRAKGEAEAIKVRGEALKLNPAFLRLQIVERWNGKSPLVVPTDPHNGGATLLLPLGSGEKPAAP